MEGKFYLEHFFYVTEASSRRQRILQADFLCFSEKISKKKNRKNNLKKF